MRNLFKLFSIVLVLSLGTSDVVAIKPISKPQRPQSEQVDAGKAERERKEKAAREKREREERERQERERQEKERQEAEARERERQEQARREQALREQKEREERERAERERNRNKVNGHEYVDLGLSVKWATCNVGASSPSGYGNYYAWGETTTKSEYTTGNSVTRGKNMSDISGNSRYDAARANWGGTWRLPTKAEIEELINNCTWEWTSQNGVNGYKVTGPNGNSIFLPAAGYRYGSSLFSAGSYGDYWSSTPSSYTGYAYYLYFGSSNFGWDDSDRYYGLSVRPVTE